MNCGESRNKLVNGLWLNPKDYEWKISTKGGKYDGRNYQRKGFSKIWKTKF